MKHSQIAAQWLSAGGRFAEANADRFRMRYPNEDDLVNVSIENLAGVVLYTLQFYPFSVISLLHTSSPTLELNNKYVLWEFSETSPISEAVVEIAAALNANLNSRKLLQAQRQLFNICQDLEEGHHNVACFLRRDARNRIINIGFELVRL